MNATFLLKGMAIGLSIAAPVGPIGVLCIRRSVAGGMWAGFASGMGAATADAAYGAVAGFGLTAVSGFLVRSQSWLALAGGAFLCVLGVRTFLTEPATEPAGAQGGRFLGAYASTFLLTLANPATILSFVAVFAAFGLGASVGYAAAASMVLGVFLGSALWWLALCGGIGLARARIGPRALRLVNHVSGVVLVAFGLVALARALAG
jgi:threonine/homoserine/homoserine lactone efflux protein